MTPTVSTIAWLPKEDDAVARVLLQHGVRHIELAPTRRWADLSQVRAAEVVDERLRWADRGMKVSSTQALLFGQPDLRLFGDPVAFTSYLTKVLLLGAALGATAQVFGSPRNRARGDLNARRAHELAVPVFRQLGRVAVDAGTCLVVEPNPPEYGSDFLNTADEAAAFVVAVASPGVRLHLDTACAQYVGDNVAAKVREHTDLVHHVHLSEPDLGPVAGPSASHAAAIRALRDHNYTGFVSVEMRRFESDPIGAVAAAASHVQALLA